MQFVNIVCNVLSWSAIIVGFSLSFNAMLTNKEEDEFKWSDKR